MDAQQLMDRLEERAAEIPVGPPPIGLMRARARRRRQGRVAVLASAAAMAAIAAGLAWQGTGGSDDGSRTPIASEGPSDFDSLADGYTYVGAGDVVAAVPQGWTRNETNCGTPTADTVIIDPGPTCLMLVPRPADVDSLTVLTGRTPVNVAAGWEQTEVAGEPALRSRVIVTDGVARQSVLLTAREVMFVAESSSADGVDVVDGILDSLTLLRDHTTVPGIGDIATRRGGNETMAAAYARRLRGLGLQVEVSTGKGGGLDQGTVLEVTPSVGSVVAPGDTIRVVAAR
ncbi:PASTA domain-containing protein [Nocardioides sp.]|uniref:PASTA domain-containing protein n=1 Tax=Nocardioides sp. TaxID=35761 RepID=UPI0025E7E299|nr:PASTA domain-containing protein [Nocardioides sp.]